MRVNYLIDTSAWVEYFRGSERGKRVKQLMEHRGNHLFVLHSTIAEFYRWCLKQRVPFESSFKVILSNATLLPIRLPDWLHAIEEQVRLRPKVAKIGVLDTLLIVKQQEHHAKIVTSDSDFRKVENVLML